MAQRRSYGLVAFCVFAMSLAACGADESAGQSVEAVAPGLGEAKGDVAGAVTMSGVIEAGATREGAFDGDLQFFGYELYAGGEGARAELTTAVEGTDADLDTTLYLYGVDEAGAYERLDYANDTMGTPQSRLRSVELDFAGRYARLLVVVGTRTGTGRGSFALEMRCTSGACAPISQAEAACPEGVAGYLFDAAFEAYWDASLEEIPSGYEAYEAQRGGGLEAREALCGAGGRDRDAAYCDLDASYFARDVFESCVRAGMDQFYPGGRIELSGEPLGAALRDAEDGAGSCEGGCGFDSGSWFDGARAFRYDALQGAPMRAVMTGVEVEYGADFDLRESGTYYERFTGFEESDPDTAFWPAGYSAWVEALEAQLGADVEYAELVTVRPADGYREGTKLIVAHSPSKRAAVVTQIRWEE